MYQKFGFRFEHTQQTINVIFHVVITPLFKWNKKDKICILFSHPVLGDWGTKMEKDRWTMSVERYVTSKKVHLPTHICDC